MSKNRNKNRGNVNGQAETDLDVGGVGTESGDQDQSVDVDLGSDQKSGDESEEALNADDASSELVKESGTDNDENGPQEEPVVEGVVDPADQTASDLLQEEEVEFIEGLDGEPNQNEGDAPNEPVLDDGVTDPELQLDGEEDPGDEDDLAPTPEVAAVEKSSDLDKRLRAEFDGHLPSKAILSWPTTALILYKETGKYPTLTSRGNVPGDIRRGAGLRDWSGSELEDWLFGEFPTPKGVEEDRIVEEIYRRWKLPGNWTLEAVRENIATGKRPEYTVDNVLVDDKARKSTRVEHWTYLELRSALLGRIESHHSREDLIDQLRIRLGLNKSFSAEKLLADLDTTPTEVNMDNLLLKAKLEEFKTAMLANPGHLTEKTAGDAHTMLYKTIRLVMQRQPAEFPEGWVIILNWINEEYSRLWYPERARMGWSQMNLQKEALRTYEELLSAMIASRDPRSRLADAALYNFDTILRYVPKELERQNVIQFYYQG